VDLWHLCSKLRVGQPQVGTFAIPKLFLTDLCAKHRGLMGNDAADDSRVHWEAGEADRVEFGQGFVTKLDLTGVKYVSKGNDLWCDHLEGTL
jgi:hypothetical protein